MVWFAYAAAWISTAAAVVAGVHVTGSAWCLWAMALPLLVTMRESKKGRRRRGMKKLARVTRAVLYVCWKLISLGFLAGFGFYYGMAFALKFMALILDVFTGGI